MPTPSSPAHEENPPGWARYVFLVILPLAVPTLVLFALLARHPDNVEEGQRLALCAASAAFNVFVLYYHATTPPHPKFLMLRPRRVAIRVHAVSGGLELVAGIAAYFSPNPTIPATIMAIAALLGHVPTSAYQTTIVFGAKAVMAPGYAFAIMLHAFCAVNLLLHPGSRYWLMSTFIVLNIYVWCRVFIGAFQSLKLFPDATYSVSIMFSGLLMVPAVIGFAGNLLLLGFVLAHALLYRAVMRPDAARFEDYVTEKTRESLINTQIRELWAATMGDAEQEASERGRARVLFDSLDLDGGGTLALPELAARMREWKLSEAFISAFVARHGRDDGQVSFDEFYRHLYAVHGLHERLDAPAVPDNPSAAQMARSVFDLIDLDSNGFIDVFELRLLLLGWGLPDREVDLYLRRYDDGDRRISFEEFHGSMRPIWAFGFHAVVKKGTARIAV